MSLAFAAFRCQLIRPKLAQAVTGAAAVALHRKQAPKRNCAGPHQRAVLLAHAAPPPLPAGQPASPHAFPPCTLTRDAKVHNVRDARHAAHHFGRHLVQHQHPPLPAGLLPDAAQHLVLRPHREAVGVRESPGSRLPAWLSPHPWPTPHQQLLPRDRAERSHRAASACLRALPGLQWAAAVPSFWGATRLLAHPRHAFLLNRVSGVTMHGAGWAERQTAPRLGRAEGPQQLVQAWMATATAIAHCRSRLTPSETSQVRPGRLAGTCKQCKPRTTPRLACQPPP